MYNKFENYLTNEFKGYPKTKEVKDFKDELLGNLIERAEEYKSGGITDDNQIYEMCIESISGFKGTLKELKGKPILIKEAKKAANYLLYFVIYLIVLAGSYLAVSFVTEEWGKTWLIFIVVNFVTIIILLAYLAIKNYSKSRYLIGRLVILPIPVLVTVGAYLTLSVLYGAWQKSWILFLAIPVLVLIIDVIAASFSEKNKYLVLELIALIIIMSVMAYLILALLSIIAWHPYWLIVVGGIIIGLIIFAVYIKVKTK